MGILDKLFGRNAPAAPRVAPDQANCAHATLAPRWESAEAMGKTDQISFYLCESCAATLNPEEAAQVRLTSGL